MYIVIVLYTDLVFIIFVPYSFNNAASFNCIFFFIRINSINITSHTLHIYMYIVGLLMHKYTIYINVIIISNFYNLFLFIIFIRINSINIEFCAVCIVLPLLTAYHYLYFYYLYCIRNCCIIVVIYSWIDSYDIICADKWLIRNIWIHPPLNVYICFYL